MKIDVWSFDKNFITAPKKHESKSIKLISMENRSYTF